MKRDVAPLYGSCASFSNATAEWFAGIVTWVERKVGDF